MARIQLPQYKQKEFNVSGLTGISEQTIQVHLGLYAGYVKNTNALNERLADLAAQGKTGSPDFAEIVRRLPFEYNGMILHEYYFGQLRAGGTPMYPSSRFAQAVQRSFGSVDDWLADFKAVGAMRGVGWAIVFEDPMTGALSNGWVTLHQDGNLAGFKPILIMDVWEHAFLLDYKPADRPKYIDAFFQNLDWNVLDERLASQKAVRPIAE